MAKILHNNIWYSPVDSRSIYEIDYEKKILANAESLFPGYVCMQFKKTVESIYGVAIPDLVLIDKDYREWIIIEVELEHHALQGDVEDQIMKFAAGQYTEEHARYLVEKNPTLEYEKLKTLMRTMQPRISVMVPVSKPAWSNNLLKHKATIAVIEIWGDDTGRYLMRVNGEQPIVLKKTFLTNVFRGTITKKELTIENASVLPDSDLMQIYIDSSFSTWKIVRTAVGAWLFPQGKSPIDELSALSFKLLVNDSGDYILEASKWHH